MQSRGYATIGRSVKQAAARRIAHKSGSTPVGIHLSQALTSQRSPTAGSNGEKKSDAISSIDSVVEHQLAAGRPVTALLRSYSAQALHGTPRQQTQLGLSRSLQELSDLGRAEDRSVGSGAAGMSEPIFGIPSPSTRKLSTGTRPETIPELQWQPPEGRSWAEMPSESRLVQALSELIGTGAQVQSKLESQLAALDEMRSSRYVARTHALAAIHPQAAAICKPRTVRNAAELIVASYDAQEDEPDISAQHSPAASARRSSRQRMSFTDHPSVLNIDTRYNGSGSPGRRSSIAGYRAGVGPRRRSVVS